MKMAVISSKENIVYKVNTATTGSEAMENAFKATEDCNENKCGNGSQDQPVQDKQCCSKPVVICCIVVVIITIVVGVGGAIFLHLQIGGNLSSDGELKGTGPPQDSDAMKRTSLKSKEGIFDGIISSAMGEGFGEFPLQTIENGGGLPSSWTKLESEDSDTRSKDQGILGLDFKRKNYDLRKVDFSQLTCNFDDIPCDWHTIIEWSIGKEKLGSVSGGEINQTGNYLYSQVNLATLATFASYIVRDANKYGSFCLSFNFYKSYITGILVVLLWDYEAKDMYTVWKEDLPSDTWRRAHVNISTSSDFVILIEAENVVSHLVAIDDIEMTNKTCDTRQDSQIGSEEPEKDNTKAGETAH